MAIHVGAGAVWHAYNVDALSCVWLQFVYFVLEPRKAARLRDYVTDAFTKVRVAYGTHMCEPGCKNHASAPEAVLSCINCLHV